MTNFFTNRDGNTLIREFEGVLANNPSIKNLDAVVGFLRASGYFSLRPFLENISKIRVLIGIDVDKYIVEATRRMKLFHGAEESVKNDCLQQLKKDIEHSGYKKEIEDGIAQMAVDLENGKLELRAHPSKKIHAKIYILCPDDFNQYTQGVAITGSSNLSGNGLGISPEKQYEFNVKMSQYDDVKFARDEFETLWEEARNCEITAEDVKASIERTYLKGDVSPYDLYIKMLMEYFDDRVLESDSNNPLDLPEGYAKYQYQTDAVIEGYQKLLRYDGFFLADVVGLGKTIVATLIAKKFLVENGRDKTKILVVYPPAVERNWKNTFRDFGIDKYAKFISNGSLNKVLDVDNVDYWNAEEYDLVLVDEAHKFRSNATAGFEFLQEICKMPRLSRGNISGHKKKVILISATPMNNSFADIYTQISLFQDNRRCTIDGVSNLTAFFSPVIDEVKSLKKKQFDASKLKALSERVRERVIKAITVRRTRTDIERIKRYRIDLDSFPTVEPPIKNNYELNERLAALFERAMHILVKELNYARYQAIAYLKPEYQEVYDQAELSGRSLAWIRKAGLVKRLESSFEAFKISLENFRQANQNMIDMFKRDKVFIAHDLDINKMLADGWSDEDIEKKLNEKAKDNPKNKVFKANAFVDGFFDMLIADQKLLEEMSSSWATVTDNDDSKFATFQELFEKDKNFKGKLVVFSESADTVEYLKRRIGRNDVLAISSENRKKLFDTICENFDANHKKQKDDYNIILTTDVLAEGVNLHRSNVIVNYDTPWNSTKLMQRIGRVNRIGSKFEHIYNYVFYPSREGNKEIKLNEIALTKIQTFHSTFGEDSQIYSEEEEINRDLDHLFDEAINPKNEEVNQELPYYEELHELYKNHRREYDRIKKMSLRSRTGRQSRDKLSGDTLVFLKTNFRKVFFLVSEETTKELSVIDALKYFKAEKSEPSAERIPQHHDHVEKALKEFDSIRGKELDRHDSSQSDPSSRGAQVNTAMNLLDTFMREIDESDLYQKVSQLKSIVERGTITSVAKRLQRIHKDLGRSRTTREEAFHEVAEMAREYAPYYVAEEALEKAEETDVEIILSESFTQQ